jgi:hypothetical protein
VGVVYRAVPLSRTREPPEPALRMSGYGDSCRNSGPRWRQLPLGPHSYEVLGTKVTQT